jgi:hypothetical protein
MWSRACQQRYVLVLVLNTVRFEGAERYLGICQLHLVLAGSSRHLKSHINRSSSLV